MTPLQLAAARGQLHIVTMLLEAGAEVDDRDNSHEKPDFPWTALASSCLLAHAQMLTQLLRFGADPRLRCNGMMPSEMLGLGLPPALRSSEELERMGTVLRIALSRSRAEAVQFAVRLEQVVVQQGFREEEAALDALVTAAAVAEYGRVAMYLDAKSQVVLDCFRPVKAAPARRAALWSRRSSAETECTSYEKAGCLLPQMPEGELAGDERSVAALSTVDSLVKAGRHSEKLAFHVAIDQSLAACTTLLEALQTAGVATGKLCEQVTGVTDAAGSTAANRTTATAIGAGTTGITGATSALRDMFEALHSSSRSNSSSSSSSSSLVADRYNTRAAGNSYSYTEQCPLCGEAHLNPAAAHTSQCWSSDSDRSPFRMYSVEDSSTPQQQQPQQHAHVAAAVGSVANAVRVSESSSAYTTAGRSYAMGAQAQLHSAVGSATAAAAATISGASRDAAPYYTAVSKAARAALPPRSVWLQQWEQYRARGADDRSARSSNSSDDEPVISSGVQAAEKWRSPTRLSTPDCSPVSRFRCGFRDLSDTSFDSDDKLLRSPTWTNEWCDSVERRFGDCANDAPVAAEQRFAAGAVSSLPDTLSDTASPTSPLEKPPYLELLIPDTLQQQPDGTDVAAQIRAKLQWLLQRTGSDSATASACTDSGNGQRELQLHVPAISDAISLLREHIDQVPQCFKTAVESAQAERDAVQQQYCRSSAA
jgi:Ankyrin repeat